MIGPRTALADVTSDGNVSPVLPAAGGPVAAPMVVGDTIGTTFTGIVTIDEGSDINVNGAAGIIVGDDATAIGLLSVSGFGSTLTANTAGADLVIGNAGAGEVLVDDFANVFIQDDLLVGDDINSLGNFEIDGLGTIFDVNDRVDVGNAGDGVILVTGGARVFADDTVVGTMATGEGRLTISGQFTFWRQPNSLTIGDAGRGTLQVFSQAELESFNGVIGDDTGSIGIVEIDGVGSTWDITGFMSVGVNGQAWMDISGGGRVTNSSTARLATQPVGEAHVEVRGLQSLWDIGSALTVGEFGFATLKVLDGGRVTTGSNVIIGDNTNSRGEVTVDGENSVWEITGTLDVSQPGEAKLTISNGGHVTATGVLRVAAAGELHLDGGRITSPTGTGLTNNGLVRGGGDIVANVSNASTGEVRIAAGDALVMHGTLANAGLIDIQGGELEVFGATTNSVDIDVRGGTLRFQSGLTNLLASQFAIVGGDVDVFGAFVNNLGGQVVVGGESHAAFHDAFTNNGSLLVTAGSELLTLENLGMGGGGSLIVELGDSLLDGFGQVQVGNTATVAGTLQVDLVGGFEPQAGDTFQIVTAGVARSGTFATENLPVLGGGLTWDVIYNPMSIVLSVIGPGGITGDFNDDGVVDAADYVMWRKFNGSSATLPNDSSPGQVDINDYEDWAENFGATAGSGGNAGETVPEPRSVFVVLSALVSLAIRPSPCRLMPVCSPCLKLLLTQRRQGAKRTIHLNHKGHTGKAKER
jgi:T5SS/PEP-CTERM-associated repeat protein